MDTQIWVILALVLASLAGSAIMFLALRKAGMKRQELEAFARQQGWTYEFIPGGTGVPMTHRMTDPGDSWAFEIRTMVGRQTGTGSGRVSRVTLFRTSEGALEEGAAVIGPTMPEKTLRMLDGPLAGMGGGLMKKVLFQLTRGLGVPQDTLEIFTESGGDPRGTILATPGQRNAVTPLYGAPELTAARAGRNEALQPVVMRTADGMEVRIREALKSPDQILPFVELGRALRDRLRNKGD